MRPRSLPIALPAGEFLEVVLTDARPHNVMPRLGASTDNRPTCRIPRWAPLRSKSGLFTQQDHSYQGRCFASSRGPTPAGPREMVGGYPG